jgi:hypothetical protein
VSTSSAMYLHLSKIISVVIFTLFVFFLRIVVSNTYCVVFLLCFSSSYVASFSGLLYFDCPFGIL